MGLQSHHGGYAAREASRDLSVGPSEEETTSAAEDDPTAPGVALSACLPGATISSKPRASMKKPTGSVKTATAANSISMDPAMNNADPIRKRTTLRNTRPIGGSFHPRCREDEMASAD